jgi:hypothetical protein
VRVFGFDGVRRLLEMEGLMFPLGSPEDTAQANNDDDLIP